MSAPGNAGTVLLIGAGVGGLYLAMAGNDSLRNLWRKIAPASAIAAVDAANGGGGALNDASAGSAAAGTKVHNWFAGLFTGGDGTPPTDVPPAPVCPAGQTYNSMSRSCDPVPNPGGGPYAAYLTAHPGSGMAENWRSA